MIRAALIAAALLVPLAGAAEARQVDPARYAELVERYAAACNRMSPQECEIGQPASAEDAQNLACLFDELDQRAGDGTATAHVGWAESYAATGQPPGAGFPTTIGEQEILITALIACGGGDIR